MTRANDDSLATFYERIGVFTGSSITRAPRAADVEPVEIRNRAAFERIRNLQNTDQEY